RDRSRALAQGSPAVAAPAGHRDAAHGGRFAAPRGPGHRHVLREPAPPPRRSPSPRPHRQAEGLLGYSEGGIAPLPNLPPTGMARAKPALGAMDQGVCGRLVKLFVDELDDARQRLLRRGRVGLAVDEAFRLAVVELELDLATRLPVRGHEAIE